MGRLQGKTVIKFSPKMDLSKDLWTVLCVVITSVISCEFDPSSDNILYSLNWPGPISDSQLGSVKC